MFLVEPEYQAVERWGVTWVVYLDQLAGLHDLRYVFWQSQDIKLLKDEMSRGLCTWISWLGYMICGMFSGRAKTSSCWKMRCHVGLCTWISWLGYMICGMFSGRAKTSSCWKMRCHVGLSIWISWLSYATSVHPWPGKRKWMPWKSAASKLSAFFPLWLKILDVFWLAVVHVCVCLCMFVCVCERVRVMKVICWCTVHGLSGFFLFFLLALCLPKWYLVFFSAQHTELWYIQEVCA